MHRFKIFLGTVLFALSISVLTTSTIKPTNTISTSANAVPIVKRISEKEARLYTMRKKALNEAVRSYFETAIKNGDIVGAGVSIVSGDSIILSDGFGKRSVAGALGVDGQTVFRLGSISKGFTGVLAANLESKGAFGWDDKVVDFLPDFKFGDAINTNKVRVAHLLSHTSGTPYHSFTNLVEAGLPMSAIAKRFNEVDPISEPGLQYSYQNAMFSLSQEIMFKKTGKDIQTLLTGLFFEPLGMETISMDHETLLQVKNVALPHRKQGSGWRSLSLTDKYYNAIAAGGINASPTDMAKWMRFLLGHNPKVMSKEALGQAFEPFVELNEHRKYYQQWPGHLKSAYGFGWRIHTFKDEVSGATETIWHHGGSVNSYRNEIALFPDSDVGICVLLNSNSRLARTVIPDLHKLVDQVYAQTLIASTSL